MKNRVRLTMAVAVAVFFSLARADGPRELERQYGDADVVFECRVESVGPCAGVYSGFATVRQEIRCRVGEVFKGSVRGPRNILQYTIASGSLLEDGKACINRALVARGARFLAFGEKGDGTIYAGDRSVVPRTTEIVDRVRSWREECEVGKPPPNGDVRWTPTADGGIRFESEGKEIGQFEPELLRTFLGDTTTVLGASVSPSGAVAIDLNAPDIQYTTVLVGDVGNRCPARDLTSHIWRSKGITGVFAGRPTAPLWVSDSKLAFLIKHFDEPQPAVILWDVAADTFEVAPINEEPLGLTCVEGRIQYSSAADSRETSITCR